MKNVMTGASLADRIRLERRSSFVGRETELARLAAAFEERGPVMTLVVGLGGIGKSSLLDAFAERLGEQSIRVLRVDCRAVEPTSAGLLSALGQLLGAALSSPRDLAQAIAPLGPRLALTFDHYEAFRILDGWLRQQLLPPLPASVRVFACARSAPIEAWTADPGWGPLVQIVRLGPLDESASRRLLEGQGIAPAAIHRLQRLSQGHPLTLQLAARALTERPDLPVAEVDARPLIEVLAPMFLEEVEDARVRRLLEAGCLIRRVTRSGLAAMVPEHFSEEAFVALGALPFVEMAVDGLVVHETVRAAIAASLRALDPERHQALRRAAWTCLRAEVAGAARAQRWRYMADLLYLVDRPEVREAFFPSEREVHGVEAARPSDGPAILALARAFDQGGAAGVEAWWAALPNAFHVVRAPAGGILAFHAFALASEADAALQGRDPQTNRWLTHLRTAGISADSPVFFNLRVLAAAGGEAASPPAIACWLDAKRFYLEHPDARRIYVGMAQPEAPLTVLSALGFSAPASLGPGVGGVGIGTILLDFGLGGVLGWLAGLVDAQFARAVSPFDVAARALRTANGTVPLTKLEFGVMEYLDAHTGRVVTRDELLQNVWEQSFGGSNVVDAVVKSLRKKLGPLGSALETVIGHGYRYTGFPKQPV
jgi:Transcriptional regulatory protein, C terminal/AAA ATPase domain